MYTVVQKKCASDLTRSYSGSGGGSSNDTNDDDDDDDDDDDNSIVEYEI
jgi:hypothetical protein